MVLSYDRQEGGIVQKAVFEHLQCLDRLHKKYYEIIYETPGRRDLQTIGCNKRKSFWVPAKNAFCSIVPCYDPATHQTT